MKHQFLITGVILLACILSACSAKPVRIQGTAMKPNFNDGDRILMTENLGAIKRGEVVMLLYPKDNSKSFIKRVIGLPEDTIEIRQGKVLVNNEEIAEPYLDESFNKHSQTFPPRKVPLNHYYVMGDNRDNSSDSRYWGTVSRDLITGKYYMTYLKGAE